MYICTYAAFARRTNGRKLGTFKKGRFLGNRGALDREAFSIFFSPGFKMLKHYLSLSVLSYNTAEILNEDSRTLELHYAALIVSCLGVTNARKVVLLP
jgi:hypothetical protein